MRTFTIMFCCVLSLPSIAQRSTFQNFAIVDNDVIYSKVFVQEGTDQKTLRQQLLYSLRNYPFIRNVTVYDDGVMTADLIDYQLDYKKIGATMMQTPLEILKGIWIGKAVISFKDNKYRVVVQSLSYSMSTVNSPNQCPVSELLSTLALNNQRDYFREGSLDVLDFLHQGFSGIFAIQTKSAGNDNW